MNQLIELDTDIRGSARPQVLMLTHRVPFPPDRGDRIRSWNILRHISMRADVSLGCICDEPQHPDTKAAMQAVCRRVVIAPVGRRTRWVRAGTLSLRGKSLTEGLFWSPRLAKTLDHWADCISFDAALVYCSSMLSYTQRRRLVKIPKVVDLVDADSQKWQDYATGAARWKRPLYRAEARRVRELERHSVETSRAVTLVSDAEADVLKTMLGNSRDNIHGLSNGVDTDFFNPAEFPPPSRSRSHGEIADSRSTGDVAHFRLAFVGVLNYHPNIDGLLWFASKIWPALRERYPFLTLDIIGRHPTGQVMELENLEGITVVGPVDDVRQHLAAADAVIAPLRIARGIQNKVLEAMAMKKAVIATPQAAAGIEAIPDKELIVCETIAAWQEAISELIAHPELAVDFGSAARELILNRYNWSQRLRMLDQLLGLGSSTSHEHER